MAALLISKVNFMRVRDVFVSYAAFSHSHSIAGFPVLRHLPAMFLRTHL